MIYSPKTPKYLHQETNNNKVRLGQKEAVPLLLGDEQSLDWSDTIRSATSIRERGWLCFLLLLSRTFSTQLLLGIFGGWLMDPCCGLSLWAAQTAHPNRKLWNYETMGKKKHSRPYSKMGIHLHLTSSIRTSSDANSCYSPHLAKDDIYRSVKRTLCVTCGASELSSRYDIHCVPKKEATKLLAITFSNLNRFSKFFHCSKEDEISNKIALIFSTRP